MPTCGIEPVLGGLRDESEVWTAVRNQYRGIYDLRPGNHDRRIASGDDCEAGGMLLDWCKLDDLWWDHGLSAGHNVIAEKLAKPPPKPKRTAKTKKTKPKETPPTPQEH